MAIRISLSKVVRKPQTKTSSNSIFNVVGKRKTKTESRILFSDDVGKRKTKLEVRIPFSQIVGKRLALRNTHSADALYTHCFRYSCRQFDKDQSSSLKKALRRNLELKQQRKELQAAAEKLSSKRIAEGDERLRELSKVLTGAGYIFPR